VRERRRFRGASGELPLFKGIDDEEGVDEDDPAGSLPAAPDREPPSTRPAHGFDDDLPLRPRDDPRPAPPVERPASGFERLCAAAVDIAVLAPLWAAVVYFASRSARVEIPALQPAWPWLVGYLAFLGLVYAGYFTGTTGQTLGKMAAGLRVVDSAGQPPGYLRAFTRAVIGTGGVLAAGSGLLPMLFDPARRALHDRLFRTRVVKG
jgi:uncharacterized RDD family membrane protein YckC